MAASFRTRYVVAIALGAALLVPAFATGTASAKPKHRHKTFVVCKHGCKYRTIQSAVDKAGKGDTVRVRPGKYVEGVLVKGPKRDGLRIVGTGKDPAAVVLEGKNAKTPDGSLANHGIEGDGADHLRDQEPQGHPLRRQRRLPPRPLRHGEVRLPRLPDEEPDRRLQPLLRAVRLQLHRRAHHPLGRLRPRRLRPGTSAPRQTQRKPKWTSIDNIKAFRNVLGFWGTNSKYVNIADDDIYNNRASIVPQHARFRPYCRPAAHGIIQDQRRLLE